MGKSNFFFLYIYFSVFIYVIILFYFILFYFPIHIHPPNPTQQNKTKQNKTNKQKKKKKKKKKKKQLEILNSTNLVTGDLEAALEIKKRAEKAFERRVERIEEALRFGGETVDYYRALDEYQDWVEVIRYIYIYLYIKKIYR